MGVLLGDAVTIVFAIAFASMFVIGFKSGVVTS